MLTNHPTDVLERPLANSYWVIPSRLLGGEYPGGADDTTTRNRLASLQASGIDSFIDLTEDGELPPYRHLLTNANHYHRSAIVDASVPNNVSEIRSVLATIRAELDRGRHVYVHCRAGIGRTGLVMGCFLAGVEGDGKKALKLLNRLWLQSERAQLWPKVPQTAAQADYVRRWPALSNRQF